MDTKQKQQNLAQSLKLWQNAENATITQASKVMSETDHPLIRLVMEIIQRDSHMHYRVQQMIIDSLERPTTSIQVEDLEKVWGAIELHMRIEQNAKAIVDTVSKALEGSSDPSLAMARYLLSYLLTDEKKHDELLENLALIKKGLYP